MSYLIFETDRSSQTNSFSKRARTNHEIEGQACGTSVDYLDTYAAVVKLASIWTLLAIAVTPGLKIHQMDVVTTFLAGN